MLCAQRRACRFSSTPDGTWVSCVRTASEWRQQRGRGALQGKEFPLAQGFRPPGLWVWSLGMAEGTVTSPRGGPQRHPAHCIRLLPHIIFNPLSHMESPRVRACREALLGFTLPAPRPPHGLADAVGLVMTQDHCPNLRPHSRAMSACPSPRLQGLAHSRSSGNTQGLSGAPGIQSAGTGGQCLSGASAPSFRGERGL